MTNIHSASLRLSPCNPARPPARNSLRRHGVIIDAQRHRRVAVGKQHPRGPVHRVIFRQRAHQGVRSLREAIASYDVR